MGSEKTVLEKTDEILEAWLQRVSDANVLLGKPEAVRAQFASWLELLAQTKDPEKAGELHRLVAIQSRNHGLQKRPASAVLRQILCLQDAVRYTIGPIEPELLEQIHQLAMIAADGHFLGHSQKQAHRWTLRTRDFTPVLQVDEESILTFLFLPHKPEVLDACYGRAMKLLGMTKCQRLIVDVAEGEPLDERFYDTTKALIQSRELEGVNVVFTGINPDDSVGARIAQLPHIRLSEDLADILVPSKLRDAT